MLLSMTGFGEARYLDDRLSVVFEVRAVNNRHLKLIAKISDAYSLLEPDLERQVRETIRRGTVHLSLRVDRPHRPEDYRLNTVALASYRDQLKALQDSSDPAVRMADLLGLPGVVESRGGKLDDPREDWPIFSKVVAQAIDQFQTSRAEEGRAMAEELAAMALTIADRLALVEARGPEIVAAYEARLHDRVRALVEARGVAIEARDLIREVAIHAERADVAEEIIRLKAHLVQFGEAIAEPESAGRKLEFIVQEMGRETNTIGSKANDIEISRNVVEMKGALEKIRELIQNVE